MTKGITKQQMLALLVVMLFGGSALAYAVGMAFPEAEGPGIQGQAFLEVEICGERRDLPTASRDFQFGEITVDQDNRITFPAESGATLGHVFDTMNKTFSRTELMGYENNNMCNTTWSNEVTVSRGRFIEGREEEPIMPVEQYDDYLLNHGDYIVVRYD